MKTLKRWALLILALLLTAAGAAMPCAVSLIQDARVETMRENRTLSPVSLTLQSSGVQETLLLLSGSASYLEWQGKTKMTAEQVAAAVTETLWQMGESGLVTELPEDLLENGVSLLIEPLVVMSMEENSFPAIIWECWSEELSYIMLCIDDETGKMVRATVVEDVVPGLGVDFWMPGPAENHASVGKGAASEVVAGQAMFPETVFQVGERWRAFLSGYYGMELLLQEDTPYDETSAFSAYFTLTFDMAGERARGEQDTGTLRLEIQGSAVYFNP